VFSLVTDLVRDMTLPVNGTGTCPTWYQVGGNILLLHIIIRGLDKPTLGPIIWNTDLCLNSQQVQKSTYDGTIFDLRTILAAQQSRNTLMGSLGWYSYYWYYGS
jgi:hypothetical protein